MLRRFHVTMILLIGTLNTLYWTIQATDVVLKESVEIVVAASKESKQVEVEPDDRTLLDVFGEVAKEYLTQKLIPKTDPECRWDWHVVRCEPYCDCAFTPKRGDYHLGRSCRLRSGNKTLDQCDADTVPTDFTPIQLLIQTAVIRSQAALRSASTSTKKGYKKVQESVCRELPVVDCAQEEKVAIAWQQRLFCSKMIPKCPSEPPPPPRSQLQFQQFEPQSLPQPREEATPQPESQPDSQPDIKTGTQSIIPEETSEVPVPAQKSEVVPPTQKSEVDED